jgi:hypothetical protein
LLQDKPGATGRVPYAGTPLDLVRYFRDWDGNTADHHSHLNLCLVIFLVCEALRFRSIEKICSQYVWPIGGMPSDPLGQPIFTFTVEMLDTVRNWDTRARAGDPDVWTWPPDMPDTIVY